MRWPWQKSERRETATDYTTLVSRLIQSQADGQVVQGTATAAVEAAAGALGRAFASATVEGPGWASEALTPLFRAQVGRDLVRSGQSCHIIRMRPDGRVHLVPASTWYFEGESDPESWTCTATAYGPSGSSTWRVPFASVILATWGTATARPYHGLAPTSWASASARVAAQAERSLGDEASGIVAQLLPIPKDGGGDKRDSDNDGDDSLALLRADIAAAKGAPVMLETTAAGWGEGQGGAPRKDWMASRLGPSPPTALVELARDSFARTLAACGCSPALFDDSDGTAKREALRQWHLGTVQPLAGMLAAELTAKLAVPIRLEFDLYNVDLAGRAQAFQKLVAGGMPPAEALVTCGLLAGDAE